MSRTAVHVQYVCAKNAAYMYICIVVSRVNILMQNMKSKTALLNKCNHMYVCTCLGSRKPLISVIRFRTSPLGGRLLWRRRQFHILLPLTSPSTEGQAKVTLPTINRRANSLSILFLIKSAYGLRAQPLSEL